MGALVATAAGLVLGVGLGAAAGGLGWAWPAATLVLAAGTVLALLARRASVRPRAWLAAPLAACAAIAGAAAVAPAAHEETAIGPVELEGTVEELRARADRTDAVVRVARARAIGEHAVAPPHGARVRVRGERWTEGTHVEGTFALAPVTGFRNPTPHPPWPMLDPVRADARAIAVSARAEATPLALIGAARAHVRAALIATLDEPACGVARALILGDLALDAEDEDAVRGAGLAHVLAVSGMHVTLLIGALVWLLGRALLRVPRVARRYEAARIAAAIGVPLALVYAPLAGGAPSAWRAALTAAIAWSLRAGGRRPDAIAVTAGSVIAFGIADPETLVRPAFLLSIAATAAILAPIEGAEERPVRAVLIASVRASVATAPVVLWCFEGVPISGVLANVVVVPIASAVLLPLAAVHAAIASVVPALAGPSAAALDLAARSFLASCQAFAEVPLGRGLPPLDLAQGVVVAATCGALLLARGTRAKAIALAVGALLIAGAEWRLRVVERPEGVLRATFLDVGQGDGALLDMPDGSLWMIDAGGAVGAGADPGARAVVPLLRARRRARIDVAVITHPHPDHYGGLAAVLDAVEVGAIWDTGQAEDETPEGELAATLRAARERGIDVRGPRELCGRDRWAGAARARVLWPCPTFDAGWDPNDNSFVIEIAIGARRLLFAGDAEEHAEGALAAGGALGHVDLLKVAHHGSRTSSTPPFLAALAPDVAVISAGRGNRFGHPHPEVAARLEATADHVVRTDRDGGVIATTDGATLRVTTWAGAGFALP